MTSQDNLRDRIAGVIHERTAFFGGHAYPETLAQAIIDEFGLTVEPREHFVRLENNGLRRAVASTRIVGKWRKSELG